MKKLILTLMILIAGLSYAQDSSYQTQVPFSVPVNNGLYWQDSLHNNLYVSTDTTWLMGADTTVTEIDTMWEATTSEINLGFNYEWMTIVIDTNSSATDSAIVEFGVYRLSAPRTLESEFWSQVPFMLDSAGANKVVMLGGATPKTYMIAVSNYDLIRVRMLNETAISQRLLRFNAILSRKR